MTARGEEEGGETEISNRSIGVPLLGMESLGEGQTATGRCVYKSAVFVATCGSDARG